MNTYIITSKVYVTLQIPISFIETLILPPKGNSITIQFKELPEILKIYENNNLISIKIKGA